jgi:hypothetical protein
VSQMLYAWPIEVKDITVNSTILATYVNIPSKNQSEIFKTIFKSNLLFSFQWWHFLYTKCNGYTTMLYLPALPL